MSFLILIFTIETLLFFEKSLTEQLQRRDQLVMTTHSNVNFIHLLAFQPHIKVFDP